MALLLGEETNLPAVVTSFNGFRNFIQERSRLIQSGKLSFLGNTYPGYGVKNVDVLELFEPHDKGDDLYFKLSEDFGIGCVWAALQLPIFLVK